MKKRWLVNSCIAFACACLCACSSDSTSESEDEPAIILSTIAGQWDVTAYQDGTNYVPATNPEYYLFEPNGAFTHVYEHTPELIDTTTGQYVYDPEKRSIHVDEPRGWNLDIAVQFLSDTNGGYKAIFNVTGRTPAQTKTVKVQRR